MSSRLFINRAAVVGGGVMGAAIATHLANAGIPVVRNRLVRAGLDLIQ